MSQAIAQTVLNVPFRLKVEAARLTEQQFVELCRENRDLRFELTADKELVIMAPTGSETGRQNSEIAYTLTAWAKRDGTGLSFDSSTGFRLPNGAIRSPDAAWVRRESWHALSPEQRRGFAPLCPDFVLELRSPSDQLSALQDKMQEYIDNGARLAWLLDPSEKRAYIYRPGRPVERRDGPPTLRGDPVLPGFVLRLDVLNLS
ncbi:MAG: Uma2 family endonuclease [Desulfurellaceae bacterium]|nr:Uma2 family endonuclease [Desulfurellaceae bacterium]